MLFTINSSIFQFYVESNVFSLKIGRRGVASSDSMH